MVQAIYSLDSSQLVVRAYEILKSDEYNEDFRISKEISRYPLALAGISYYRQKFRESSGKILRYF